MRTSTDRVPFTCPSVRGSRRSYAGTVGQLESAVSTFLLVNDVGSSDPVDFPS